MRDSTIIYRSFYEAIKGLPKESQADVWDAIFQYSLDFKEVQLSGICNTIFILIKPQLDANIARYKSGLIPKGKRSGSESKAKRKRKVSESEANANENDNVNENENDNVNENGVASPKTIIVSSNIFKGTTSEWLKINKQTAIDEYLMKNYPDADVNKIFEQLDSETNSYHFKDTNHPFNYFKTVCKNVLGNVKQKQTERIRGREDFYTEVDYMNYCKRLNLTPKP